MTDTHDIALDVTVIVVSYNHGAYVTEALDSAAAQTVLPRRIIAIDDASSDNSAHQIKQWADRHRDIDVLVRLHQHNKGLSRGLNEAITVVDTPLYTVMSADDRMLPNRLEKQVARWRSHGGQVCALYSNALRIDASGSPIEPDYATASDWERVTALEGTHLHSNLLRHNWIPAASVLLAREAVASVGGYNEDWFIEDHDLWLRLAATGQQFLCVDEPLVEIRELPTSMGSTHFGDNPRHLAARLGILLDQYGVSDDGDAYIHTVAPDLAVRLWRTGARPDLVRAALSLPGLDRSPRWWIRVLLIRLGVTRQPAPPRWLCVLPTARSRAA